MNVSLAMPLGGRALLEYVALSAPTVGDAMDRAVLYHRFVRAQRDMSLEKTTDAWTLRVAPRGGQMPGLGRHVHEAFIVTACRIGSPVPRVFFFANQPPADCRAALRGARHVDARRSVLLGHHACPEPTSVRGASTHGGTAIGHRQRGIGTIAARALAHDRDGHARGGAGVL